MSFTVDIKVRCVGAAIQTYVMCTEQGASMPAIDTAFG